MIIQRKIHIKESRKTISKVNEDIIKSGAKSLAEKRLHPDMESAVGIFCDVWNDHGKALAIVTDLKINDMDRILIEWIKNNLITTPKPNYRIDTSEIRQSFCNLYIHGFYIDNDTMNAVLRECGFIPAKLSQDPYLSWSVSTKILTYTVLPLTPWFPREKVSIPQGFRRFERQV